MKNREKKIRDYTDQALLIKTNNFGFNPSGVRGRFNSDFNKICAKVTPKTDDNCRLEFPDGDLDGRDGVFQNMYSNKDSTKLDKCKKNHAKWDQHAKNLLTKYLDLDILLTNIIILISTARLVVCHLEDCSCTDTNFYSEERTNCPEINELSDLFKSVQMRLGSEVEVLRGTFGKNKTPGNPVQMSPFEEKCTSSGDKYWPSNQQCESIKNCNYKYIVMTTSLLWEYNFGFPCTYSNDCDGTKGWGQTHQLSNWNHRGNMYLSCKDLGEVRGINNNNFNDSETQLYAFGPPLERSPRLYTDFFEACTWAIDKNTGNIYDYVLGAIPNYCPKDECGTFMMDDNNFEKYQ